MSFGDTTSTGMTSRTGTEDFSRSVNALFDTREQADRARRDLIAAGIPDSAITLSGTTGETGSTTADRPYHEEGFWESLKELFMPEEDRFSYAEGIRRGGYLISVRTDTASYDRAVDILDRDGAVNVDERESSWRNEGWSGYTGTGTLADSDASYATPSAATAGFGASNADRVGLGGTSMGEAGAGSRSGAPDSTYAASAPGLGSTSGVAGAQTNASSAGTLGMASTGTGTRGAGVGEEETIPVLEENVRIGKRDVSHGRVRIRSYVVETPVNEEVTLRSENVQMERRPVDRPVTGSDRLFQDRTIEAEQYSEEAVVQKDVRVKEEIALRKEVEQHTQTVSETARRTEVEVEDERGNAVAATTPVSKPKI